MIDPNNTEEIKDQINDIYDNEYCDGCDDDYEDYSDEIFE